jgi:hypothetical protein
LCSGGAQGQLYLHLMSCHQNAGKHNDMEITNTWERVLVTSSTDDETKHRLNLGNACHPTQNLNIKTHKTTTLPVVSHSSERCLTTRIQTEGLDY